VLDTQPLQWDEGLAHGLLGANGAGKSTLIKVMMGLVSTDAGDMQPVKDVSMLPEKICLPLQLTAYQVVQHASRMQLSGDDAITLLREVRLKEEAWHQPMRLYSKGMQQRAAIAYALAGKPKWLILDEPMSGLDAMGRKQMLDVFTQRQQQGASILMCSHAITDLVRLCQQVHIMADGKVKETVYIQKHSMDEVEMLESRLMFWSADHAVA